MGKRLDAAAAAGALASLPMSCSIVPARHPNAIAMQWRLPVPVWGSKADKIISQRKDTAGRARNHQDSIVSAAFLGSSAGVSGFGQGRTDSATGFSTPASCMPAIRCWMT